MAAGVRKNEKASKNRQRKREVEDVDKVEVAPGVTVGSLGRFRAAMIGPTQRLPDAASATLGGNSKNPRSTVL